MFSLHPAGVCCAAAPNSRGSYQAEDDRALSGAAPSRFLGGTESYEGVEQGGSKGYHFQRGGLVEGLARVRPGETETGVEDREDDPGEPG